MEYAQRDFPLKFRPVIAQTPDLGLWTHPYAFRPPNHTWSSKVLQQMVIQIHGFQWNQLVTQGQERYYETWQEDSGWDAKAGLAREEVSARMAVWQCSFEAARGDTIGDLYLEWGAKIICCLTKELDVRLGGLSVYDEAHRNVDLPFQRLNMR
ncbi:hypothetical protein SCP_0503160 [Sparassis crispa]|uniref:Uncharacterized protein n=1 Tax=Sparassis crispa TaxID=139825 RepID=A0A401GM47_9APHY|nr:hypothetical protein SCP_0503160 [Sparassis crispa]GBE83268.1 hypothetical protein SCP_0503160 [Sparassis crispa]